MEFFCNKKMGQESYVSKITICRKALTVLD